MSGTGATLFRDSSVRVRRHSVIVGKVSVDVNVAENDGSPVFIVDGSLGNAPGVPSFCSDDLTEERVRRAMGNGKWAHGQRALASSLRKGGRCAVRPSPRPGGVWLWWAGVVVLCCVVVGMCQGPIPVWDVASIANLGLGVQMACALRSLRPMPDGSLTAHSGPGICRCLLRSTSTPSVSSVLSPIPANNGCSGLVC